MPKLFFKIVFFYGNNYFLLKSIFYYLNDNKTENKGKIIRFYIKVSPFQKWTFYKCPNPKNFRNNYKKKKITKIYFFKNQTFMLRK